MAAAPSQLELAASQFPQFHFQGSRITAAALHAPSYLTQLAAFPLPSPAQECLSPSRSLPHSLARSSCGHALLAAVSSEPSIKLYNYASGAAGQAPSLEHYAELKGHSRQIYDIKFHNVHASFDTETVQTADGACLLSSCSQDGTVKMWDVRQREAANTWDHPQKKPFISCASAGNLLAAGSGPFLFLWDLRSQHLLAANEDFHTEDINQIAFHPLDPTQIYTGSEDGLLCVIKPEGDDQDEWLHNVLNIEYPLSRFGFFGPQAEYVWALSCVETLSLWHVEQCERISDFAQIRDSLSQAARMPIDYLVDAHYDQKSQRVFLASGCNSGELVLSHVNKNEIQPFCLAHVKNRPQKKAAADNSSGAPQVSPVTGFSLSPLPSDSPFALSSLQATAVVVDDDAMDDDDDDDAHAQRSLMKDGEVVLSGAAGLGDDGVVSAPLDANDEGHTATIRDVLWMDGAMVTAGEDSRLCLWSTDASAAAVSSGSSALKAKDHSPMLPPQGGGAPTKSLKFKPY